MHTLYSTFSKCMQCKFSDKSRLSTVTHFMIHHQTNHLQLIEIKYSFLLLQPLQYCVNAESIVALKSIKSKKLQS